MNEGVGVGGFCINTDTLQAERTTLPNLESEKGRERISMLFWATSFFPEKKQKRSSFVALELVDLTMRNNYRLCIHLQF